MKIIKGKKFLINLNFRAKNHDFDQKQNYQKLNIIEFWQFFVGKIQNLIEKQCIKIPTNHWFLAPKFKFTILSFFLKIDFLNRFWDFLTVWYELLRQKAMLSNFVRCCLACLRNVRKPRAVLPDFASCAPSSFLALWCANMSKFGTVKCMKIIQNVTFFGIFHQLLSYFYSDLSGNSSQTNSPFSTSPKYLVTLFDCKLQLVKT